MSRVPLLLFVFCVVGAACGGRKWAETLPPDPDAGGDGSGGGTDGSPGGTAVDGGLMCPSSQKKCADSQACVAAAGCCDQTDCPPQSGKLGTCDTAMHACNYACAARMKACNGECIAEGACCVDTDCMGACQKCSSHACTPASNQTDPTGRCSGTCDEAGACKSKQGQKCTTATANGCVSGSPCVDGYCCDQACTGTCLACDVTGSEGKCAPVASGNPHGARACMGAGTACAGQCSGRSDGECDYPAGTCGTVACSGADAYIPGVCKIGTCVAASAPQTCPGGYTCASNACRTKCLSNGDCQAGYYCKDTVCAPAVALKVAAGNSFACAVMSDTSVRCWGGNFSKNLGNDSIGKSSWKAVRVMGLSDADDVTTGMSHACAMLANHTLKCWGDNRFGQLGSGSPSMESASPLDVANIVDAVSVSAGQGTFMAAASSGGIVLAWGQAMETVPGASASTPVKVEGLPKSSVVGCGAQHACAFGSGAVWCWGDNHVGQLGKDPGNGGGPFAPVSVNVPSATTISVGFDYACAIVSGGEIECWGNNLAGDLGIGTNESWSWQPKKVVGLTGASAVSAGRGHTCALLSNRTVRCWGQNRFGQLGLDPATTPQSNTPAPAVPGITDVVSLSVGQETTCVVTLDGTIKCWGWNPSGEIGADPAVTPYSYMPTTIPLL